MEYTQTQVLGTRIVDGKPSEIVRHQIICDEPRDIFAETHSEFSKDEKKQAKLNHKNK